MQSMPYGRGEKAGSGRAQAGRSGIGAPSSLLLCTVL